MASVLCATSVEAAMTFPSLFHLGFVRLQPCINDHDVNTWKRSAADHRFTATAGSVITTISLSVLAKI
jgi:hypothetical protein